MQERTDPLICQRMEAKNAATDGYHDDEERDNASHRLLPTYHDESEA